MKRVYNKETRRENGVFYRVEDWGVSVEDDFEKPNFTTLTPPNDTLEYGVPCDFTGDKWVIDESSEEFKTLYQKKRKKEFLEVGCTIDELTVALWEKDVEGRPEKADELQAKRVIVKNKHPKPT
jgi:hypothetical protein